MADSDTPLDRERRLLEAEDGRFFAIDVLLPGQKVEGDKELGAGLISIAGVERAGPAKLPVAFGLPSAPALFLNLAHKAFLSYQGLNVYSLFDNHPSGLWPDNHGRLFNYFEAFSAHVIFTFMALESFANEMLPDGVEYDVVLDDVRGEMRYTGEDVELKMSLEQKLTLVLPEVLQVSSPKGLHTWRDFKTLQKTRHRLVHLKRIDRRRKSDDKTPTIWGYMLNNATVPFCDQAHKLMGHYGAAVTGRRWHEKYPYAGD